MSNTGIRLKAEALRVVAFGAVTNAYVQVGAAFTHTIKIITFKNTTNQDIYVSLDGAVDAMAIVAGSQVIFDLKTNDFFLDTGFAVYIKYPVAAPTIGNVYVEAFYG